MDRSAKNNIVERMTSIKESLQLAHIGFAVRSPFRHPFGTRTHLLQPSRNRRSFAIESTNATKGERPSILQPMGGLHLGQRRLIKHLWTKDIVSSNHGFRNRFGAHGTIDRDTHPINLSQRLESAQLRRLTLGGGEVGLHLASLGSFTTPTASHVPILQLNKQVLLQHDLADGILLGLDQDIRVFPSTFTYHEINSPRNVLRNSPMVVKLRLVHVGENPGRSMSLRTFFGKMICPTISIPPYWIEPSIKLIFHFLMGWRPGKLRRRLKLEHHGSPQVCVFTARHTFENIPTVAFLHQS